MESKGEDSPHVPFKVSINSPDKSPRILRSPLYLKAMIASLRLEE